MNSDQTIQLAKQHHQVGRLKEAEQLYRQVLGADPSNAEALLFLGLLAHQAGKHATALDLIHQSLAFCPDNPVAYNNLAAIYGALDRMDDAIAAARRAVDLSPNSPISHNNLGSALKQQGELEKAIPCFRDALRLNPDYAAAHYNLGTSLLAMGDLNAGWKEYEWRWKCPHLNIQRRQDLSAPVWTGQAIDGLAILLHADQGFGDAIQFVRYVPPVAKRTARVVVECQPELVELFGGIGDGIQVISHGQPLPTHDLHCPLLSLPGVFATTLENIPAKIPYLAASDRLRRQWKDKLGKTGGQLKVGIAWAGSPTHQSDRRRSCGLDAFAPLADLPNVELYSLQKRDNQRNDPAPSGMQLIDLTAELSNFAETAALISNLDLVISVDTAVAHLAGAIGKPVWSLHAFVPEWRWLLHRQDSPWYPTMRLFRQDDANDWDGVMRKVCGELSRLSR